MDLRGFGDRPPKPDADDFLSRLTLTRVDRDIFTGWCHSGSPLRAFGGQVAAQALVAAGSTVDGDTRQVHSLHAYFLRPGRTTDHIVYMVDRPRDGRSFSTRRVRAVQYGETIFTMSVSFAVAQQGPEHGRDQAPRWFDAIPSPEDSEPVDVLSHIPMRDRRDSNGLTDAGYPLRQLLEMRHIDTKLVRSISDGFVDQMNWIRSQPLPADPLIHECALTYLSDLTLVRTVLSHHGGSKETEDLQIASIDHAMWFHASIHADEWLLFSNRSPIAGDGRGFATGGFYTSTGLPVASVAQEVLVREHP
ncbi:MAG: acyl-CoA thioesterase II [Micrococcales bacterium]|nr:acyl-CoA thioesterase II [Micrococcales bacterium]